MDKPVNQNGTLQFEMGGRFFALRDGQLFDAEGHIVPLRAKSERMVEVLLSANGRLLSKD